MPLAAMKKASVFMTADYSEIAVPFLRSAFAQRLIIGRPALSCIANLLVQWVWSVRRLADGSLYTTMVESFRGMRKFSDI